MNEKSNFGVALTKCYYCGEDSTIVINRILTERYAKKVEDMHRKVVDMTPCPKCEQYMKDGIILITIDDRRSKKDWQKDAIPNPFRTGCFFVVKESALERILDKELFEYAKRVRWLFVDHCAAEELGLMDSITEEEKT